jgi:hypothetical protein
VGLPVIVTETNRPRGLARRLLLSLRPVRRLADDRDRQRRGRRRAEKQVAIAQRQIDELKAHVNELSTSAPPANGAGSEAIQPLNYLFVMTYGRSGSTLVQGLLDSIPGYLIRGENRGAVYRLYQFHRALEDARDQFGETEALTPRDSWYGIDQYSAISALVRMRSMMLDTLLKPQPDTRVIGFKEIRWFYDDWERYLTFFRELFPGARFVINTRDHNGVANSKWFAKQPKEDVLAKLAGFEAQLDAMAAVLGDAAYRVHYDDYVADPKALAGLFDWLGEPFDVTAVTETMAVKHSF